MKELEHLDEYLGKVASVYDGDTIRVDVDLGFDVWVKDVQVRLLGINTPEVRGDEREAGLVSRDALREMFRAVNGDVMLRTFQDKKGKYGRWLGEVFVRNGEEWESVNAMRVDRGLAVRAFY